MKHARVSIAVLSVLLCAAGTSQAQESNHNSDLRKSAMLNVAIMECGWTGTGKEKAEQERKAVEERIDAKGNFKESALKILQIEKEFNALIAAKTGDGAEKFCDKARALFEKK